MAFLHKDCGKQITRVYQRTTEFRNADIRAIGDDGFLDTDPSQRVEHIEWEADTCLECGEDITKGSVIVV